MRLYRIAGLLIGAVLSLSGGYVEGDQPAPPQIIKESSYQPVIVDPATMPPPRPVASLPTVYPIVSQIKPTPRRVSGATVADAKAYALAELGSTQYACLDKLYIRESNWNPLESYGLAYGIPQALPGSKMATAGSDWRTNPVTQVKWGLGYISARYRTACAALDHSYAYNWY